MLLYISTPHPTSTPLNSLPIAPDDSTQRILGGVLGGGFILIGMVILMTVVIAVGMIIKKKRRNTTNGQTVHKHPTNHAAGRLDRICETA